MKNELDPDLKAYLDSLPPYTKEVEEALAEANRKLFADPDFIAKTRRLKLEQCVRKVED